MSPPSNPITVVTSPTGVTNTSTPTKTSPPTPQAASRPVQYRIEEHRRTIFLTSSAPPAEALGELLSLPEISDEGAQLDGQTQRQRRAKSLNENDLVVLRDNSNQKLKDAPNNSPRTLLHGRNLGIAKGGGSSSTPTTPTSTIRGGLPRTPTRHRILFYHRQDPHYGFTNFSPHPVVFNGKRYPTSEHLFQSFKFQGHRPNLAEHIRTCSERPSVAFSQARRFQPEVRHDWMEVNIQKMDETLWYKFTQHSDLKKELLSTGDAELVEDSDKDAFWGVGSDRRGRNELGKALERLRTRLRTRGVGSKAWYKPSLPTYSWKADSFDMSAPNQTLCVVCGFKPRYGSFQFCGKTCARKASTLCNNCYAKNKFPPFDYCGKTCAASAKAKPRG